MGNSPQRVELPSMQWFPNLGQDLENRYRFLARFQVRKFGNCPGICIYFFKPPGDFDIQAGLGNYRSQGSQHNYSYWSSTYISRTRGGQDGTRCEGCINLILYREGPSRLGLEHMAPVSISCINSGIHPVGCQFGTHLEHYIHSAIQKGRLFKNTISVRVNFN